MGLTLVAGLGGAVLHAAEPSTLDDDETVKLFRTDGAFNAEGQVWRLTIHGWVYEPEADSAWRDQLVTEIREQFGVPAGSAAARRLRERLWPFLVDNERGEQITIRLAGRDHALPVTGADGHTRARLSADLGAQDRWLDYTIVLPDGDDRMFTGTVQLIAPTGLSVISDIDDTVRISHTHDTQKLLRSTFLEPWEPTAGMAAAYRQWANHGAAFHYVSSSPWQLHDPLVAFLDEQGFPAGSMHLQRFRWKQPGAGLPALFASPAEKKLPVLRALIKRYPGRRFVLVGDGSEQDPEIYGELARQYADRVVHVFIRQTPGAPADAERLRAAFADLPIERWTVFEDAALLRQWTWPGGHAATEDESTDAEPASPGRSEGE
jgi:hypothetical protein